MTSWLKRIERRATIRRIVAGKWPDLLVMTSRQHFELCRELEAKAEAATDGTWFAIRESSQ